jgi:hypothetical protein
MKAGIHQGFLYCRRVMRRYLHLIDGNRVSHSLSHHSSSLLASMPCGWWLLIWTTQEEAMSFTAEECEGQCSKSQQPRPRALSIASVGLTSLLWADEPMHDTVALCPRDVVLHL